jgi:hypothetical protein
MSGKLRLVNVERGWATLYSANIEWDGRIIGYVQKRRGAESYYAYAGGRQVARSRTLTELRQDLRESLEIDLPEWSFDNDESRP